MKNKVTKVLALSVLGLLALTACDEVVAKPTKYEDPLVVTPSDFNEEIHNNIASVVYDSIHDTGIGGDVLNQVLYLYSISAFGPYDAKVKVNGEAVGEKEITLAVAANDPTKIDEFVKSHKVYWDEKREDSSAPASENEKQRVIQKYKSINSRIAEEMYNKISGSTYVDRHEFSEEKFLKALRGSLESVSDPAKVTEFYKTQILPEVEPENVFGNYLHRDYYDSADNTYVVDEIVPTIYRQLLTEQYVRDETYNTLGRSYARKVNIVKFVNNDNYPNTAFYLANKLVGEINQDPALYANTELGKYGVLSRFKDYSNAQVGIIGALGKEVAILNGAADPGEIDTGDATLDEELTSALGIFYLGTSYGDLAEKYIKMKDVAHNGISSDLESTFTNSGAYPTYVGLKQEKDALRENDYTMNGWYIKNGGLTDIPDSIRSRLFNIGVATGVKETTDDRASMERTYNSASKTWSESADENAYVCRINGHNYLKTASRVKGDSINNDILHYDADSKTYYIVEIEEAVSSSKLSKNGDHNYVNTRDEETMQLIINEVCEVVAKGESYSTLATKKYLKAMDIEYHDESVYDYFKTNYPELFDSDADTEEEEEETPAADTSAAA